MTNPTNLFGLLSLTTCLAISPAMADEDSGLFDWDSYEAPTPPPAGSSSSGTGWRISDTETSFKGAIMLKGDVESYQMSPPVSWKMTRTSVRILFPAILYAVWKIAMETHRT